MDEGTQQISVIFSLAVQELPQANLCRNFQLEDSQDMTSVLGI